MNFLLLYYFNIIIYFDDSLNKGVFNASQEIKKIIYNILFFLKNKKPKKEKLK